MQKFTHLKKIIDEHNSFLLTTHVNPDADALGSELALHAVLKKLGKKVRSINHSATPYNLEFLDEEKVVEKFDEQTHSQIFNETEVVIVLDLNQANRVVKMEKSLRSFKGLKICIDHHQDPEDFAHFRYWSTKAAATCELVYELIVELGDESLIDKDIAECLYAGIMTDTGGFRHPNTTKNVHLVVAELLDKGADSSQIANLIYDSNSVNRLKFIGFAITRRLVVREDLHTAYFVISKKDLKKYQSQTGDTEGLVNYALSLDGIKLAALFSEREDGIKISFRSSSDVAVNKFAASHFNGGGHKNAAGGKSAQTLKETVERFESLVEQCQVELFHSDPVVAD